MQRKSVWIYVIEFVRKGRCPNAERMDVCKNIETAYFKWPIKIHTKWKLRERPSIFLFLQFTLTWLSRCWKSSITEIINIHSKYLREIRLRNELLLTCCDSCLVYYSNSPQGVDLGYPWSDNSASALGNVITLNAAHIMYGRWLIIIMLAKTTCHLSEKIIVDSHLFVVNIYINV